MNRSFTFTLVLAPALLATAFVARAPSHVETGPPSAAANADAPVWSVDLVRTLPGAQMDYVRSIETNWAGARAIARERGAVLSYRVASPDFVAVEPARPSTEMREFMSGDVVLREFVSSGGR